MNFVTKEEIVDRLMRRRLHTNKPPYLCLHPFPIRPFEDDWCSVGYIQGNKAFGSFDIRVKYGSEAYNKVNGMLKEACGDIGVEHYDVRLDTQAA